MKWKYPFNITISGKEIKFARGRKDDWCVKVAGKSPRDAEWINEFRHLTSVAGNKVARLFEDVYQRTTETPSLDILKYICENVDKYENIEEKERASILIVTLYYLMISEYYYICPNGEPSILNKDVKRLAVMKALCEKTTAEEIANWSKYRPARDTKNEIIRLEAEYQNIINPEP